MSAAPAPVVTRQLPDSGEVFLDHVGHFVADPAAAAEALARAGFMATPLSVQVNPDPAGGPPRLTGAGNVCAMLRAGYLEVLYKTADTPLGAELDAARARYDGLHLVAFAVADAETQHARLAGAGFAMQPLVRMQRPVETATGPGTAAFEVVRVKPGEMVEGRVQMLLHRTEDTVWQPRWLDHPNGATGLMGLTIVVADLGEAARRFERFTGRRAKPGDGGATIALDRGTIELVDTAAWAQRWPEMPVPSLPYMGAATIEVASLETARRQLGIGGLAATTTTTSAGLAVPFPRALGLGMWHFVARGSSRS
jgi:hypothetical protein